MNKEFLNQCLKSLKRVGEAKYITLFGSYGVFINGNLIGKAIHDDFYVKADEELISFFCIAVYLHTVTTNVMGMWLRIIIQYMLTIQNIFLKLSIKS
ncbi:hypothetical protein VCRA2113O324_150013 [Vibrio crassostreae]|nr:hypothetical protein VCRA2111O320_140013 [Vibrio crassostreae]CAK1773909.1 hypothetical protein VCRA2113O324_150013 [Vibrio crassostreae]CAK2643956.1 hypothetical protein VCRA2121O336_150013 [Vibrio crassostreae]CAK3136919.1 hypothetical protein VCRA2120O329_140013 [Vibrio crassostreae]CAK3219045.1 hypothetical protein VCRA217O316_140127 [Vibrio crassostreae]